MPIVYELPVIDSDRRSLQNCLGIMQFAADIGRHTKSCTAMGAAVSDETDTGVVEKERRSLWVDDDDDSDVVEEVEAKPKRQLSRRSSQLRLCIRRCIAEDETWDLKTVPDLNMLVVKFYVDSFAGKALILSVLSQL